MIAPGFCRAAHSSMFKMQAPGSKGGVATAKQASDGTMKHISGFSPGKKTVDISPSPSYTYSHEVHVSFCSAGDFRLGVGGGGIASRNDCYSDGGEELKNGRCFRASAVCFVRSCRCSLRGATRRIRFNLACWSHFQSILCDLSR